MIPKAKEDVNENAKTETVTFETLLKNNIGEFGRYQLKTLIFCCIFHVFIGWANDEYIFTTARTTARCKIPECDGDSPEFAPEWILNAIPGKSQTSFESCQRYVNVTSSSITNDNDTCPIDLFDHEQTKPCDEYVYEIKDSIAYEFDLACDEWKRTLVGTSRTAGTLLAQGLTGYMSDRWGRRTALMFNIINTTWLGILRYWANSYSLFIASEILEALLGSAGLSCAYILAVEFVGHKYRMLSVVTMFICSSLGHGVMAVIAWQFPYWRHLTLAMFIPMAASLVIFMFMDESVRWLMSCGRFEKSKKILLKAAKTNKREVSQEFLDYLEKNTKEEQRLKEQKDEKKSDCLGLAGMVLQNKTLITRCIICPLWWMTMRLVNYGLKVNSVNLSGNKYINYGVVSIVGIPGHLMALLIAERFGRRISIIGGFWSCAVCQIVFMFTSKGQPTLSLVMYMIGKMCISTVSTSLYVYTAELFPTRYRHSFFAFSSVIGRLGNVLAPMTPALAVTVWEYLPYTIFAGGALIAGLLVFFTPETRNKKLPETIEDLNEQK